jgi:hypothetical protein
VNGAIPAPARIDGSDNTRCGVPVSLPLAVNARSSSLELAGAPAPLEKRPFLTGPTEPSPNEIVRVPRPPSAEHVAVMLPTAKSPTESDEGLLSVHMTLRFASRMVTRVREADALRMNVSCPIDLGNLYATFAWYPRLAIGNTPVAVVGAAPQAGLVATAPTARTAKTTEPARLKIAAAYQPRWARESAASAFIWGPASEHESVPVR